MTTFRNKYDCDPCPLCNNNFSIIEKPNYPSCWKFICNSCNIELVRNNELYLINYNFWFFECLNKWVGSDEEKYKFLNKNIKPTIKDTLKFGKKYFENIIFE